MNPRVVPSGGHGSRASRGGRATPPPTGSPGGRGALGGKSTSLPRNPHSNLADQIGRAATSITLNLGEGRQRTGGDQRRMYEIAHGSAAEVRSALAVGVAWGWVEEPAAILATMDRLMALLWRLTHGRMLSARAALGHGARD